MDALGAHVGAGHDEARQLVDGVERLLHRRLARDVEEVGVRGDGAHELGREALALELGHARPRVAVLGVHVGVALVVEVVEHAHEAPFLLVAVEAGRVGAHRGLDRQDVLAQGRRFGPLAEKGPCLRARKGLRHGWYPSPPLDHGKARHRGRRAAVRHHRARRQQERGPAAAGRQPAHRRAGRARQRPAHPRHGGDAGAARRPRRHGRVDRGQHRLAAGRRDRGHRRRPGPGRAHPRLLPRRRAAARALRLRVDAAAGRRRHRPPAPGPAPRRLPRARRARRARPPHQAVARPTAACARPTSSWTSRP